MGFSITPTVDGAPPPGTMEPEAGETNARAGAEEAGLERHAVSVGL